MYCMHCGEQIAENSRYCKYCGKLVAEDEIINIPEEDEGINNVQEEASSEKTDEYLNEDYGLYDEDKEFLNNLNDEEEIIDDFFFEHMSRKKKIALFLFAVFMTAIVAAIVFAAFFPELLY